MHASESTTTTTAPHQPQLLLQLRSNFVPLANHPLRAALLPSTNTTMPREVDPSINESDFLHKSLAQGLRTDGRSPYDMRQVKLSFGDEFGWVQCKLGETRCVQG